MNCPCSNERTNWAPECNHLESAGAVLTICCDIQGKESFEKTDSLAIRSRGPPKKMSPKVLEKHKANQLKSILLND